MRESERLETECDFEGAARAALAERDARRAIRLACIAGDDGLMTEAEDALVDVATDDELVLVAEELIDRGFAAVAGRLFESAKRYDRAGAAYADGGDVIPAARAFEKAGQPAQGARVIEMALRDHATPDALRLELARLLVRHGRTEAAVRVLQAMSHESRERRLGLPLLARSLKGMGLAEAAHEVELEMEKLAISPDAVIEIDLSATEAKGTIIFGRYETVREVAKTMHARVIEATDRITGARVAVKLLVSGLTGAGRDAYVRFEREARALTQIKHPAVVPILAYHSDGPGMVLEWMPGGSLADMLKREVIAPARAAEVSVAILSALGEAHRIGVLHRDVKPANVLFDGIGSPRLADFGAAHLADLSATATAAAIGTLSYMSPEQRLGRSATVRSDVYAVGVLLYEMITGEMPNHEDGNPLVPFSDFHADLGDSHDVIGTRLLEQDPERRPADAFEARKLIESVTWSKRVLERAAPASVRTRSSRPPDAPTERLGPARGVGDARDTDRLAFDRLFERDVIILETSTLALDRARAFARAGHASLPTILRASPADSTIWVLPPLGRAVADGATLGRGHVARLRAAIEALHEAGGVHGALDFAHVYLHEGTPNLAFPRRLDPAASREGDLVELEKIASLVLA